MIDRIIRASKIAKEFNQNYVLKGAGNEFERIDEIKNTNSKFIIPVNFPEAYDVSNSNLSDQIDLSDLRFWNQAPTNLKVLAENNVVFALTTDKLKKTFMLELPNWESEVKKVLKDVKFFWGHGR